MTFAEPSLPQNFLTLLRQPSAIAVLASIGLHGLVWAASPWMRLEDSGARGPLNVGVVQLSPEELKRLPQNSTALFNPALTPSTPNNLGFSGALPPLPALPPPPSDLFGQLPTLESMTQLPQLPSFSEELPPLPLGELPMPPVSNPWVSVNPDELPKITPVPFNPDLVPLSGDPLPNLSPEFLPQPPGLDPSNGSEPTPAPQVRTPTTIPQAAIDRLRELQRQKAENPGSTLDPTLPQQAQDWIARAGTNAPKKLFLSFTYPSAACSAKGYATVTTTVNGNGAVVRSEITQSSGVAAFDEVALKVAKGYAYEKPSDGQSRTYWSPFTFDPSKTCSAAPTSDPPTSESKPESNPPVQPTAPEKPAPPVSQPEAPVLEKPASEPSPAPTPEPAVTPDASSPPPETSPSPEPSPTSDPAPAS
jgi:TonB family protein